MAEYWEVGLIEIVDLVVTGISGAAAVAAVVVSLWQVGQEKRARAEKLRRSQAETVSCWFEDGPERPRSLDDRHVWQYVVLKNESESSVYDAIVTCVGVQGAGPAARGEECAGDYPYRRLLGVLPPGEWGVWLPTSGLGMSVVLGAEIAFRDARGVSWVRRGNGILEETKEDPVSFYGVELPCAWVGCERRD